ncbi:DUF456 domain-containing protein [Salinithrix halophila]|uniref:DUF456 domain-containing protein n=1 Tax=Salinithrix halophila TaxID=1485204 RepID=A0ABV8JHE8_9BACL
MEILWWLIVLVLFLLGFAGLFLPVLPDMPLFLGGFAVYHFLIDPTALGLSFWVGAVLITIGAVAVDYVAGGIAAKTYGGSRAAVWAAFAGALVGIFLGPAGLLIGPLAAVILVELLQKKSWEEALRIGYGTLVGFLGGIFFKGLLMVGLLIWFLILVL